MPNPKRVSGWFDALGLRYGDRVAVDDPLKSEATMLALSELVSRRGIQISREVPIGEGNVNAGLARIVVTRAVASVPNCPNWADNSETNFNNATSPITAVRSTAIWPRWWPIPTTCWPGQNPMGKPS
jgi:pilus assembly protein CpaD